MSSPRNIKDRYKQESAETDVTDPIYENKDPIAVSFKARKDEGGILSVTKKSDKQNQFFYSLKLVGNGLQIDDNKMAFKQSPQKKSLSKKLASDV